MEIIPEAIVEKTWQEVAGFSPDRAEKEMMKIGNSQPELLAFVMESSQEMGQEVRELAIYYLGHKGMKSESSPSGVGSLSILLWKHVIS